MAKEIWGDDLTDAQLRLLMTTQHADYRAIKGSDIVTARHLAAKGLVEMGYWITSTADGNRVLNEFSDETHPEKGDA